MAEHLLLEIGLEEVPARFVRPAAEQLLDIVERWLDESRIARGAVRVFATPRRLAVLAEDVADRQADRTQEAKGPALSIAKDEQGNWTKAALGFARSQGVDPADLEVRDVGGTPYVFAVKTSAGGKTEDLLPRAAAEWIRSMSFPKSMRWGGHDLRFIRPIRWIVFLYGDRVVPLELAGVSSGRVTRGHRFLGSDVSLARAGEYAEALRRQYVLADPEERKQAILDQIRRLSEQKGWTIAVNEDLLEEVLFLVEYPTVLSGSFDPAFLAIPQDVLITSMREHQRYFPVFDAGGKLLPHFVTVRNGDGRSLDVVARGNEKVLRARLTDARFFYEEDKKLTIDRALGKLETIVYREELGTVGDKVRRVRRVAGGLAERLGLPEEARRHVDRAAHICKFDLVTQMVYEFPELQGIMGEDYARLMGEPEPVCRAVNEHYRPRHAGDGPPESPVGAVVGLADKMDTIAGCFSIGIVPTGSQDPYALRRQATGIVQTLIRHGFPVCLDDLFRLSLAALRESCGLKRDEADIMRDLRDFFALRIKNALSDKVRHDVAEAVMESGVFISPVPSVIRRAEALEAFLAGEEAKAAVDAFNRVCNLAVKAESGDLDERFLTEPAERELYKQWQQLHIIYNGLLEEGREERALAALAGLRDAVNAFFDAVLVMAEDPHVRQSRLALLSRIAGDIRRFADFSRLVK
jgi:glycyl-tRNA synthetase beta chain